MAKFKIWMVALTLIMGISLTSCFNSDNNTIVADLAYGKCTDIFPPTFELFNGQKMVVSGSSLTTLNMGEIYGFYYQFDSAEQPVNSPSITINLYNGIEPFSISAKSSEGPMNNSSSIVANSALYAISGTVSNVNVNPVVVLDNEYLIASPVYWIEDVNSDEKLKEELAKHAFILTYDSESIEPGDNELVLTLNHIITETGDEKVNRNKYTYSLKAYQLTYVLNEFENRAGNKPTKIVLKAQTNTSKDSLEGATEQVWEYTIK